MVIYTLGRPIHSTTVIPIQGLATVHVDPPSGETGARGLAAKSFDMGSSTVGSSPGQNKAAEKPARKSSLHVLLPKSLHGHHTSPHDPPSPSPSQQSPGDNHNHVDEAAFQRAGDPTMPKDSTKATGGVTPEAGSMSKLMKRESYKAQRKTYQLEKKRVANELFSMLKDPSVIVLADWLKVRGTLKGWTKLWCVLKPGLLLLYKNPKTHKSSNWVGTVLISTCELIERPSKKDGFCFKLFHPLEQSIWATRGPKGETIGAVVQPLPTSYLIFRAPSESAGKYWMDALELALRCSSLLIRSMSREGKPATPASPLECGGASPSIVGVNSEKTWNESDCERHFSGHDLEDDQHTDDNRDVEGRHSMRSTDSDSDGTDIDCDLPPIETPYVESGVEEFGLVGDAGQTEEVAEENKSLIWALVKQVRPGMDLSKVVLPTFILEPRSFLEKLTDYYYHSDIIARAVLEDDPYTRMKSVVRFYLSGFYKKPRGLKKPYNPILGEVFRCYWRHPETGTRTFYLAEQISHHPPVSAFYATNRKDGYCVSGTILAKSKFYGNSLSAILDGKARLHLLTRGEDYVMTLPYAHCKGIVVGTLTMEMGGKVTVECEKTGYRAELEFKLKPFLGGSDANLVAGKIKLGMETLATLEGHWDQEIFITEKRTEERQLFWNAGPEIKSQRLKRFVVPMEHQQEYESERLWRHVSVAISRGDQVAATEEKTLLEETQRQAVKERRAKREDWIPRHFEQDVSGEWVYKHSDLRPWDPRNDVIQYECDCIIRTKTRLKTPVVRTSSIIGVDSQVEAQSLSRTTRTPRLAMMVLGRRGTRPRDSGSSSPDCEGPMRSLSSDSDGASVTLNSADKMTELLNTALGPLHETLQKNADAIGALQRQVALTNAQQEQRLKIVSQRDWIVVALVVLLQCCLHWLLKS